MGPDHWELAERTLRIVLEESEVFTPQAPEFVDALFLMGDALNRSGQCERAIAVLEEAMERYPDEPRNTNPATLRTLIGSTGFTFDMLISTKPTATSRRRSIDGR
jgi:hypothetical protein